MRDARRAFVDLGQPERTTTSGLRETAKYLQILSKRINHAFSFLLSRRDVLQKYSSLDDLAYDLAADPMPAELKGLNHNMVLLRDGILAELRRHAVFIGASVVEELVFDATPMSASQWIATSKPSVRQNEWRNTTSWAYGTLVDPRAFRQNVSCSIERLGA